MTVKRFTGSPVPKPSPDIDTGFAARAAKIRGLDDRSSPKCAGAVTDPVDDLLVARLAARDTLDETRIGLDVLSYPGEPVCVEKPGPRLLASGNGWFFTRCSSSTAACSTSVG